MGAVGLLIALAAPVAPAALAGERAGSFNILFENDMFGSSRDRHFTHGSQLSWLSPKDDVPDFVKAAAAAVPFFDASGALRVRFSLGQNIYTPNSIAASDPDPDTRPYAGWLYGGVGLVSDTGRRLDVLELNLGIVGPESFAEEVQTNWHGFIGIDKPKGWDRQLGNELGILLTYERKWRSLFELSEADLGLALDDLSVDVTPHLGGALGNVLTYGAAGATLRFGKHLKSDYGPPRIRPSLPGSGFFEPDGPFGWYLFAGAEGRLVARNIFLDGNSFANSRGVDKNFLVGDLQFGVVLTFPWARLAYTHILRSKEFETQADVDQFGAISLSFRF